MAHRVILLLLLVLSSPASAGNPLADCGTGTIGCAPRGVWSGTFRGRQLTCCVTDHRCDADLPNELPLSGQCILGRHQRRTIQLYAGGQGTLCRGTAGRGGRGGRPCCTFLTASSSGGAFIAAAECKHVLQVPLSLQPN